VLRVDLDEELSEATLDATGAEVTDAGRETLVLSWFVTPGELSDPDDDDASVGPFDDETQRTLYVPGQSAFDALLSNGWRIPFTDQRAAELVLVLRDGRGGVAWRRDQFVLVAEQP
jgi:hypothetical protein